MVKPPEGGGLFLTGWFLTLCCIGVGGQPSSEYGCPTQERILPCRCSTRDMEIQIWQVYAPMKTTDSRAPVPNELPGQRERHARNSSRTMIYRFFFFFFFSSLETRARQRSNDRFENNYNATR